MAIHMREKELQSLGLTEKEAKVYLSSLELGESPVQDIARKAGVNRATTYVMIEQLTVKGLMSSLEKGKKRYFLAESPDKLVMTLRLNIAEMEEKMISFKRILPDLHALYDTSGEKPRVRFFEGEEGVLSVIEELHEAIEPGMEVRQMISLDDWEKVFGSHDKHDKHKEKMLQMDFHSRIIFTSENPKIQDQIIKPHRRDKVDTRWISKEQFPFAGEFIIAKNKVFMATLKGKYIAVIIESEQLASMLGAMFEMAWSSTKK